MNREISQIRFMCTDHKELLEVCGNARVFSSTCSQEPERDKDGWLTLDTSELFCSGCIDDFDQGLEPAQNWVVEAR